MENYEDIPMIQQPKNLKIQLFPHQLSLVYMMEELEIGHGITGETHKVITDIGVNADMTGYGKTLSMVTLILRDKMEWDLNTEHIEETIQTYSSQHIKKYTNNWIYGDRLKNFINNFLIMIYEFEKEIIKIEDIYDEDIPLYLTDNVFTSTIFKDPVIAEDGFTYEREAITKWFNNNNRSPTSGKILNLFVLYKNNDMRSRCIEWKELHTIKEVLK